MPDQPMPPGVVYEERQRIMQEAHKLSERLIMASTGSSAAAVLIAAETCIAFCAANAKMPLQDVMDNLFRNMPGMYETAAKALALSGTKKG